MKFEMNEEWRKPWVEALRSGKYAQTSGALRSYEGGYCCLGVLADICGLGEWTSKNYYKFAGNLADEILPEALGDVLGLCPNVQRSLAELNDHGRSFEHIADVIENGEYAQESFEPEEYDAIRGEE